MRSRVRLVVLVLILACCSAGYFYALKQSGGAVAAAVKHERPDRAPSTEEEKLARQLVDKKDFAAVDQALDAYRKEDARTSDGLSRLSVLYEAIATELAELDKYKKQAAVLELFEQWKKANPQSQGRRIALAGFYKDAAWRARGADVASTVRQDQWKTFESLLTKAFEPLNEARNAEPYDPHVAGLMFTVGMAAGMPKETAQKTIDEVMEKYPTYEPAYKRMAVFLLPRWAGEPGDLEAFMADVRKRLPAPLGDIMYAHISNAVFHYVGSKFLLETDLKYDEMKSAFETLFEKYPDDRANRRTFSAIAAIADDKEMTRDLLQQTTGTWAPDKVRSNYRSAEAFAQVQDWVNDKAPNPIYVTPLEAAFELKDAEKLQAAVANGADLDRQFSNGTTPLILALSEGQAGLARFLIEQGASTTATARNGYTVAGAAVYGDNVEMLQELLDEGLKPTDEVTGNHYTIVHVAALKNAVECMEVILKLQDVDVNAKLSNGQTPLFMAAMNDSVECAKMLLDAGADVNAKQTNLITPVHQAAYSGAPKTLKLLLERGANPDAASSLNVKPIDEARRNRQEETERILEEALGKR